MAKKNSTRTAQSFLGTFGKGKNPVFDGGAKYNAHEISQNSKRSTRVAIGKRGK